MFIRKCNHLPLSRASSLVGGGGGGGGGGLPYNSDGDARRLALGCKLQILASFMVFGMERRYKGPFSYRLVLCTMNLQKCPDTDHTEISLRGLS